MPALGVAVTDRAEVIALLDDLIILADDRLDVTEKAEGYKPLRKRYNIELFGSMNGYLTMNENIVRARNEASQLIVEYFYTAFTRGYTESGGDEADLTGDSDDLAWINSRTEEELGYVKTLFVALKEAKADPEATRETLIELAHERADGYTDTLDAVYNMGLLRGAKNKGLTWKLGNTEIHCENKSGSFGCLQLAGQRHKASWYIARNLIPRMPGSGTTCGGYQCDCELVDDQNKAVTL